MKNLAILLLMAAFASPVIAQEKTEPVKKEAPACPQSEDKKPECDQAKKDCCGAEGDQAKKDCCDCCGAEGDQVKKDCCGEECDHAKKDDGADCDHHKKDKMNKDKKYQEKDKEERKG